MVAASSASVLIYLLALATIGGAYRPGLSARLKAEVRHNKRRKTIMSSTTYNNKYSVRECAGGKDYSAVIGSVDAWWGGRRVSPMLPRLFFDNFCDTTFMAVSRDKADGKEIVVGFLCGFVSQSRTGEAHAHFIGIDPAHRGAGLGAALYERFFQAVKARGITVVHAVTSPINTASVAFHQALGFEALCVASSGGGGSERAGVGCATSKTGMGGDGVAPDHGLVQAEGASSIDRKFVHVDYDGPDGGDRVLLEKRL